jgi:hypothetical protein
VMAAVYRKLHIPTLNIIVSQKISWIIQNGIYSTYFNKKMISLRGARSLFLFPCFLFLFSCPVRAAPKVFSPKPLETGRQSCALGCCVVEFVLRPHSCDDDRIGRGQTIICASNKNCAPAAQSTRQQGGAKNLILCWSTRCGPTRN